MTCFAVRETDQGNVFQWNVSDCQGTPIDLTGGSVVVYWRNAVGAVQNYSTVITNAAQGEVQWQASAGWADQFGPAYFMLHVTTPGGLNVRTRPREIDVEEIL